MDPKTKQWSLTKLIANLTVAGALTLSPLP